MRIIGICATDINGNNTGNNDTGIIMDSDTGINGNRKKSRADLRA